MTEVKKIKYREARERVIAASQEIDAHYLIIKTAGLPDIDKNSLTRIERRLMRHATLLAAYLLEICDG